MVIASYMLDKAREKGYAEGYSEGYAEGYAQGLAAGRADAYADVNRQNEAYYKRMLDAREKGEGFDEPPPRFKRDGR